MFSSKIVQVESLHLQTNFIFPHDLLLILISCFNNKYIENKKRVGDQKMIAFDHDNVS